MSLQHQPVLLDSVIEFMQAKVPPPQTFLDGTFGRGGHTRQVLNTFNSVRVVAMDRDAEAIKYGKENFSEFIKDGRLVLIRGNFADLSKLDDQSFDAILLDLGVSSPQLDDPARGFSFYQEGPLDMRMGNDQTLSAVDVVNEWSEKELSDLFYQLGEIKFPNKVVRAIVHDRKKQKFSTTRELAELIVRVSGWRQKGKHPATQYFLALRLLVNNELEKLKMALPQLVTHLADGGLLMVISFHSTEDRIVKKFMRESKLLGKILTKKVIQADERERKANPRSRSAKLRVFKREMGNV